VDEEEKDEENIFFPTPLARLDAQGAASDCFFFILLSFRQYFFIFI